MGNTKIKQILTSLMHEKDIHVTELARRINLPQPTVHRIATGICEHPHLSSLKPIADFFSISVDQLKGFEPIPIKSVEHSFNIPLLNWEQVTTWFSNKDALKKNEFIFTDAKVGSNGYALKIKDASMEPAFPKNTILIADPDKKPKDRSYVIAKLENLSEPIFRQLVIDAQVRYLKPLSPDFERYKMTQLEEKDLILSVVIQAKRDCED